MSHLHLCLLFAIICCINLISVEASIKIRGDGGSLIFHDGKNNSISISNNKYQSIQVSGSVLISQNLTSAKTLQTYGTATFRGKINANKLYIAGQFTSTCALFPSVPVTAQSITASNSLNQVSTAQATITSLSANSITSTGSITATSADTTLAYASASTVKVSGNVNLKTASLSSTSIPQLTINGVSYGTKTQIIPSDSPTQSVQPFPVDGLYFSSTLTNSSLFYLRAGLNGASDYISYESAYRPGYYLCMNSQTSFYWSYLANYQAVKSNTGLCSFKLVSAMNGVSNFISLQYMDSSVSRWLTASSNTGFRAVGSNPDGSTSFLHSASFLQVASDDKYILYLNGTNLNLQVTVEYPLVSASPINQLDTIFTSNWNTRTALTKTAGYVSFSTSSNPEYYLCLSSTSSLIVMKDINSITQPNLCTFALQPALTGQYGAYSLQTEQSLSVNPLSEWYVQRDSTGIIWSRTLKTTAYNASASFYFLSVSENFPEIYFSGPTDSLASYTLQTDTDGLIKLKSSLVTSSSFLLRPSLTNLPLAFSLESKTQPGQYICLLYPASYTLRSLSTIGNSDAATCSFIFLSALDGNSTHVSVQPQTEFVSGSSRYWRIFNNELQLATYDSTITTWYSEASMIANVYAGSCSSTSRISGLTASSIVQAGNCATDNSCTIQGPYNALDNNINTYYSSSSSNTFIIDLSYIRSIRSIKLIFAGADIGTIRLDISNNIYGPFTNQISLYETTGFGSKTWSSNWYATGRYLRFQQTNTNNITEFQIYECAYTSAWQAASSLSVSGASTITKVQASAMSVSDSLSVSGTSTLGQATAKSFNISSPGILSSSNNSWSIQSATMSSLSVSGSVVANSANINTLNASSIIVKGATIIKGGAVSITGATYGILKKGYARLTYRTPYNTDGGSATANIWQIYKFNTIEENWWSDGSSGGPVTGLSNYRFNLTAGLYRIQGQISIGCADRYTSRLAVESGSSFTSVVQGSSAYSMAGGYYNSNTFSYLAGILNATSTTGPYVISTFQLADCTDNAAKGASLTTSDAGTTNILSTLEIFTL